MSSFLNKEMALDFLSRHPLPVTGSNHVEKVVKYMVTTEHAVVMDQTREETLTDEQLQKLCVKLRRTQR